MAARRPVWVEYGETGREVAFNPSVPGEALVKTPIRNRGHLTGWRVDVIIGNPDTEGGGAVKPHPVWDFLMEVAPPALPSTLLED